MDQLGAIEDLEEIRDLSRFWILFRGPRCPTCYLGERVFRQTSGVFRVPPAPPISMLRTTGICVGLGENILRGVPYDGLVIVDASYICE